MTNDLTVISAANQAISSPALRRLRRMAIGTVQWPGQGIRRYLAGGLKLTDDERAEAKLLADTIRAALVAHDDASGRKGRLGIIGKMLLAYPMAGSSEAAGKARGEAYLAALDDVPPWAIDAAVRRWHRGECGEQNYNFAPAPAILRAIAKPLLEPYREAVEHIEAVLTAGTLDDAMESKIKGPLPQSIADLLDGWNGRSAAREAAE